MTRTTAFVAIAGVLVVLTGCATAHSSNPVRTPTDQAAALTVGNAWVKAAAEGMSAAFGELRNSSDREITVVSATSPAAPVLQLHETVADGSGTTKMQEKKGGFVIPAKGTLHLAPGGNHIMLMNLPKPIKSGQDVRFTFTLADGSTRTFTAIAKDFTGANERYDNGTGANK